MMKKTFYRRKYKHYDDFLVGKNKKVEEPNKLNCIEITNSIYIESIT